MIDLSKNLQKILVSGMALVMLTGVGASTSNANVSAKHVRTHRVYRQHRNHRHNHRSIRNAKHSHARRRIHKRNLHKYNVRRAAHKKRAHKLNTRRLVHKRNAHKYNSRHHARLGRRSHRHYIKRHKMNITKHNSKHSTTSNKSHINHHNHYISSELTFMHPDEQSSNGNTEEPSQNILDLNTAIHDLSNPITNNQYKIGLNTFNGHNYWFQTHTTFFNPKPMVNMYRLHAPVSTYNNLTKDAEPDINGSFDQDDAKPGVNDEGFYSSDSHEWPTDQNGNKLYNLGHFFLGRTNEPGYYND